MEQMNRHGKVGMAAMKAGMDRSTAARYLDAGKLPYTKTGKHRRVRIEDILAFKEKRDVERKSALDTLTELSEDVGGYSELE